MKIKAIWLGFIAAMLSVILVQLSGDKVLLLLSSLMAVLSGVLIVFCSKSNLYIFLGKRRESDEESC